MLIDLEDIRVSRKNIEDPQPLSEEESKLVEQFLKTLEKAQKNSLIQVVYRGENKKNLGRKIRNKYNTPNFFERLFYIGDKAKFYFKNSNKVNKRNYLHSVNDISKESFKFIFSQFSEIFSQTNRNKVVENFIKEYTYFSEFFTNQTNQNKFIEIIQEQEDELKIQIRDYYLYLLHTKNLGSTSFFVSTSVKREIAEEFALHDEKQRNARRSVVFYYFLPNPISNYGVSANSNHTNNNLCKKLNLPIYKENFYPEQEEIAIKGALFPQYIIGIYDLEHRYFVINSHLFKKNQRTPKCILQRGFLIGQEDFESVVTNTGYFGYITKLYQSDSYIDQFHHHD